VVAALALLPFETQAGDVVRNDAGELATVAEIADTLAVLDYNHPLAGKPRALNSIPTRGRGTVIIHDWV